MRLSALSKQIAFKFYASRIAEDYLSSGYPKHLTCENTIWTSNFTENSTTEIQHGLSYRNAILWPSNGEDQNLLLNDMSLIYPQSNSFWFETYWSYFN